MRWWGVGEGWEGHLTRPVRRCERYKGQLAVEVGAGRVLITEVLANEL